MNTYLFIGMVALLQAASPQAVSPPTVDTSSEAAFSQSLERVKRSLPESQHKKFEEAGELLVGSAMLASGEEAMTKEEFMSRLGKIFSGKTAAQIIATAESFVRAEVEAEVEKEKQRLSKVTSHLVPVASPVKRTSLACEGFLTTTIGSAPPSGLAFADVIEITETSFFKVASKSEKRGRLEAESIVGTDNLAIEIKDDILRFMTRASLETGDTSAAEFLVLKNSPEWLFAYLFEEGLMWGAISSFVLNKKNGLAIWTKSRPASFMKEVPDTQSHYFRCQ